MVFLAVLLAKLLDPFVILPSIVAAALIREREGVLIAAILVGIGSEFVIAALGNRGEWNIWGATIAACASCLWAFGFRFGRRMLNSRREGRGG